MVVGMRHTSRATSTVMETALPWPLTRTPYIEKGRRVATTTRNTIVKAAEQDGEGDLVRGLLTLGAFDQTDHPVEEAFAGVRRHPDHEPVGQYARAPGDRAAVAT